jgi:hypothetical protein
MPAESAIEVRDRDSGALVIEGSPHECELLCEHAHVEGVVSKRNPDRLKYLKLTVTARVALAKLRRKLACSGRTVAEASQLVSRLNVPRGGVVYSHITKRTNTYEPRKRLGLLPTYAHLREA